MATDAIRKGIFRFLSGEKYVELKKYCTFNNAHILRNACRIRPFAFRLFGHFTVRLNNNITSKCVPNGVDNNILFRYFRFEHVYG